MYGIVVYFIVHPKIPHLNLMHPSPLLIVHFFHFLENRKKEHGQTLPQLLDTCMDCSGWRDQNANAT